MSVTSSLTELARFVGQSQLVDATATRQAVNDIVDHLSRRPAKQRVSVLLSVVLLFSSRTWWLFLLFVVVVLVVFVSGGQRAVRFLFLLATD